MTRSLPLRRTIWQLPQTFLTDALTFTGLPPTKSRLVATPNARRTRRTNSKSLRLGLNSRQGLRKCHANTSGHPSRGRSGAQLWESVGNSSLGKVARAHLDGDAVAGENADIVHPHLARDVARTSLFCSWGPRTLNMALGETSSTVASNELVVLLPY